jgi:Flp pilus assembly protein TadD
LEKLVQLTNYRLGYDLIVTAYERLGQRDRAEAIRGLARSFGTYRDATDPWMDELFDDCYDSYRLAVVGGMAKVNGDEPTAFRMLERAVQVSPKDVSARFQLGMMYRDRKDFKAAREQLQQCTVLAPDFPDAWAHLSGILRDAGDMAGADRLISIGLQNCPQSPGLHLMRARRLSDLGRMPEAIEEYKTSIRYRPNEADGYVELAVALFKLERSEEAVAILRKAIEVEPQHTDALGFLAIHAISSGNETEARRWMAQIRTQPRVRGEQLERIQSAFREKFGRSFE